MGCGASTIVPKSSSTAAPNKSAWKGAVDESQNTLVQHEAKHQVQEIDATKALERSDGEKLAVQNGFSEDDIPLATVEQYEKQVGYPNHLLLQGHGVTHIGYGNPPLKKENQDAFGIMLEKFGNKCSYFGVFDGHGNHGQIVAQFVAKEMPTIVKKHLDSHSSLDVGTIELALRDSFTECEKAIEECPEIGFRGKMSGTTASVAIIHQEHVIVASVGDSRIILVQGDGRTERLSADHRPEDQTERERILAAGGCVRASHNTGSDGENDIFDDSMIGYYPPLRVWLKKSELKTHGLVQPGPGLMLTRSLGDRISKAAGCIAEPSVVCRQLVPGPQTYLVGGSDGIWDVISDQSVAMIVCREGSNLQSACDVILRDALAGWEAKKRADNVTAVVVSVR